MAIAGQDPRNGRRFIWHLFHARPGGGASVAGDGWATAGEWHSVGGIKFGSTEVMEARFPLVLERHEFRKESGGAGCHRGRDGAVLDLRVEADVVANTAGDGARHGARGMGGGADGLPHRYVLEALWARRPGPCAPRRGQPNIRATKCKVSSRLELDRYAGADFPSTR